jgi:hypothetical protein
MFLVANSRVESRHLRYRKVFMIFPSTGGMLPVLLQSGGGGANFPLYVH